MTHSRSLVTAAVLAAWATSAAAQSEQGRLTGTVRDQSNAFVGGATISVRNERTSDARTAETDAQGKFFVGSLKPSSYTVRVVKPGFAPVEYTAMPIAAGQELTVDFELHPAGVQKPSPSSARRRYSI
jgi:hypothetical protein